MPTNTLDLVDTLEDVLDVAEDDNFHEHGEEGETQEDGDDVYQEYIDEEHEEEARLTGKDPVPDYTDLDTDFEWHFYEDMHPGNPPWPVHDWSVTQAPAAINRYSVDMYSLVARIRRLARTLETVAVSKEE